MNKIYKIMTGIIAAMLIVISTTTTVYCKTRTETGVIITADVKNNYWEVADVTGNIWYFSNGEDICQGDLVKVIFDDNNTTTIFDDKITRVIVVGYVDNIIDFLN